MLKITTMKHTEEVKMSKQTSIDWLIECLSIHLTHEQKMQFEGLFQQAQDIHKEEIVKAFETGYYDYEILMYDDFEQYYQETFKNKQ